MLPHIEHKLIFSETCIRALAKGNINFSGFLIKLKTLLLAERGPRPGILDINLIKILISSDSIL